MSGDDDDARTLIDGEAVPIAIDEPVTATHGLADVLEQARRRGYEQGARDVVEAARNAQEDVIETARGLFVIWNIEAIPPETWETLDAEPLTWEKAEAWIRRRLTPL